MVTITLQGASINVIRQQMQEFLGHQEIITGTPVTGPRLTDALTDSVGPISNGKSDVNDFDLHVPAAGEAVPSPAKRTRRTKAEIEAEKAAKAKPVETAATAPSQGQAVSGNIGQAMGGPIGKEAVHQALQQVNVAVGLPKSREILQSFGANRISEIKEDQYKAFVDKCNEAVTLS